ncbi:MAG: hypothetical protein BMS9Abin31_0050 [Gammaproteobacteria bacterium]|nr:MAG: hypothetical protein BMS9Abin31_0050 [Gammaproteobacteria bacterium]
MRSALGKFFYLNLFLIHMLLPGNVAAENAEAGQSSTEQEIISENLDVDVLGESDDDTINDSPLMEESEKPFFSFLDTPQEFISSGVEGLARNIDEFFSDNKIFYETSGTYLRLRADTIVNEAGAIGYEGDVKFKLRLPNVTRKLKFTFESDANERQDDVTSKPENTPIAAVQGKDYFAGLQATLGKEDEWQFKPSIGLRLSSNVEPYIRFRAKRKYEFNKWSIRWQETPYWFDSFGWGVDSYIELNRKISDDDLFRASTFARWTNEADQFELSQVFSMYHNLSKRRAISYFAGVYGKSEPTVFATHYLLGLTYRQNIHKDYLFIELLPQIKYEKINDFHSEHSIILRLEIVFKK